jgi:hypothetical protein
VAQQRKENTSGRAKRHSTPRKGMYALHAQPKGSPRSIVFFCPPEGRLPVGAALFLFVFYLALWGYLL